MNTTDFLLEQALDTEIFLITSTHSWTYSDLRKAIAVISAELKHLGVAMGDRVGLWSENSLFWVASYLSILKIGAVVIPLPVNILKDSYLHIEASAQMRVLCLERHIAGRPNRPLPPVSCSILWDDILVDFVNKQDVDEVPTFDVLDTQLDAALMMTSGTSSTPKLVYISHKNIQANTTSIIRYLKLDSSDRIMVVLPFHYCFGTSLLHTHLRVGGSLVLNNQFTFPERVLDLIERHRCTGFAGVPATFEILLRKSTFSKRSPKSLLKIQQAGGKLSANQIQELQLASPHSQIYIMYGQTEATARLSYLPPELLQSKIDSIGRGIPGVELRVVGESGEDIKPGEIGEIVAKGDNISVGYLDDPEGTAEKFKDGQLYTGDLATIDENGFIYIIDRKGDFVKPYGYRVGSQQIEKYLLELPEILNASIVGVPDIQAGEAVYAFVVLSPGAQLLTSEIVSFCKGRMESYMVPKHIKIVDSLPTNESGKILKSQLKSLALKELAHKT